MSKEGVGQTMKIAEIFLLHKGDNSRLKNNSLLLINSFSINKPLKPYCLHIIVSIVIKGVSKIVVNTLFHDDISLNNYRHETSRTSSLSTPESELEYACLKVSTAMPLVIPLSGVSST